MKYAIVYSSRTGNTAQLAQALQAALPQEDCVYCGAPDAKALTAPLIFAGFWTDKGTCDGASAEFLSTLHGQAVFLFGTAGFGGYAAYFEKILGAVGAHLDATVHVVGRFMCQGKMPASVLARYEAMLQSAADPAPTQGMIANYHSAATHPDQSDLESLKQSALRAWNGGTRLS